MAIIAITGNNGSGKDTVGAIIQYLIFKDRVEKGIIPLFNYTVKDMPRVGFQMSGWMNKKFASSVTECYKFITGVDFHSLSRQDKELHRPKYIQFAQQQKVLFGDDVWVKSLFREYGSFSNWIITDLRFNVEEQAIREHQGLIIKVVRIEAPVTGYHDYIDAHEVICNNGSIEELTEKVKLILLKYKII